jgi:hypothetical protein
VHPAVKGTYIPSIEQGEVACGHRIGFMYPHKHVLNNTIMNQIWKYIIYKFKNTYHLEINANMAKALKHVKNDKP